MPNPAFGDRLGQRPFNRFLADQIAKSLGTIQQIKGSHKRVVLFVVGSEMNAVYTVLVV